jgi:hypothetical protein
VKVKIKSCGLSRLEKNKNTNKTKQTITKQNPPKAERNKISISTIQMQLENNEKCQSIFLRSLNILPSYFLLGSKQKNNNKRLFLLAGLCRKRC